MAIRLERASSLAKHSLAIADYSHRSRDCRISWGVRAGIDKGLMCSFRGILSRAGFLSGVVEGDAEEDEDEDVDVEGLSVPEEDANEELDSDDDEASSSFPPPKKSLILPAQTKVEMRTIPTTD